MQAFSPKPLYREDGLDPLHVRDRLFEKFKRHITLLLEQKKSRKVASRKGYLNPRALHKYNFSDNVFQKHIRHESADTTICFLIDGSGSMDSAVKAEGLEINAIQMCGAVASAFAMANTLVLKNKIPLEVFVKSAPCDTDESLTGTNNGPLVTLTRIFSSNSKQKDYDKLCHLSPHAPIVTETGYGLGSYTSEFAVLPALNKWIKKNVKTKKCIVFNLTDGETYCSIGKNRYNFRNQDSKAMRLKYLRGLPNLTLMIDNRTYVRMDTLKDTYGDNMILASDDFTGELFRTFAGFLE